MTPKVSFGIIVLNGEPFLPFCLRALYPFAYQIIVVEGSVPAARSIARPDGHSSDGSLERLRRFRIEEDPERKIELITAEDRGYPSGVWPGEKDEMSRAYADRVRGDYLWQVDVDEFYPPDAMSDVLRFLETHPHLHTVSFPMITFWGGFDTTVDGWYLRRGASEYHRLFRWRPGFAYASHRPPTVLDEKGVNLRSKGWRRARDCKKHGAIIHHYSLVFPKQVREKCAYYAEADWAKRAGASAWAERSFMQLRDPFRVHNVLDYPSWLEPFGGPHPPQVRMLIDQIRTGAIAVESRVSDDVERLLRSPRYLAARAMWRALDYPHRWLDRMRGWKQALLRSEMS